MNSLLKIAALMFTGILMFVSCSGEDTIFGDQGGQLGKGSSKLPGTLYWSFAGKAGYHKFKQAEQDLSFMSVGSTYFFNSYDISWDNKNILLAVDYPGVWNNADRRRIVIRDRSLTKGRLGRDDLNDNQNIADFALEWPDIEATVGHISPNGKYIAVDAQRYPEMPILIMDVENEDDFFRSWRVPGIDYNYYHTPVWTTDNTLYFQIGNNLYKSSPEDNYNSAPQVLKLPEGSNSATVNPQGTKVVFRHGIHLWMMDLDGSGDPVQITTSYSENDSGGRMDGEFNPTFSPDGKYIAFLSRTAKGWVHNSWWPSGTFTFIPYGGGYGYITIIPADGKLYGEDNNTKDVIFLLEQEDNIEDYHGVAASHWYPLRWR